MNAPGEGHGVAAQPTQFSQHRPNSGEALGAHGEYVTTPGEFRPALERAYQVALDESRPSVVNVQAKKEFWLRDQYAPGFLGKIEPGVMSYYH